MNNKVYYPSTDSFYSTEEHFIDKDKERYGIIGSIMGNPVTMRSQGLNLKRKIIRPYKYINNQPNRDIRIEITDNRYTYSKILRNILIILFILLILFLFNNYNNYNKND